MTDIELTNALASLLAAWNTVGAPVANHLAPGLPDDQARDLLTRAVGGAPDELVTWFGWHNGHDAPKGTPWWGAASGIHQFNLMTFDECLAKLDAHRRIAIQQQSGQDWWRDDYFPLLIDRGGGLVVALISEASTKCRTKYWDPQFPDCAPASDSIATLVSRWADRIETGDWVWTTKPGVAFWGPRAGLSELSVATL